MADHVLPQQQPDLPKRRKEARNRTTPLMDEDTIELLGITNQNSEANQFDITGKSKSSRKLDSPLSKRNSNPWSGRASRSNAPSKVNLVKPYKDMKSNGFSDKQIDD
jgi:hypothetical protein